MFTFLSSSFNSFPVIKVMIAVENIVVISHGCSYEDGCGDRGGGCDDFGGCSGYGNTFRHDVGV